MDQADPQSWFTSEASQEYPFDSPLTARGRKQAMDFANELLACHGSFSLVVTSPFLRCIQTAAEVCKVLGVALCVDSDLGEIFCPEYFGKYDLPGPNIRSNVEIASLIPPGIEVVGLSYGHLDMLGKGPQWPEVNGRLRMAARVEQYCDWAVRLGGLKFVLVTHGDCVASTLALAYAGSQVAKKVPSISKVPYCGYAVIEREFEENEESVGLLDQDAGWMVHNGNNSVSSASVNPLFWDPSHDRNTQILQNAQTELSQHRNDLKEERKKGLRRHTTRILGDQLLRTTAKQVLDVQCKAELDFKELADKTSFRGPKTAASSALPEPASDILNTHWLF